MRPVLSSLIEKPKASNSIEQLLSWVDWRTESKLYGATRILCRANWDVLVVRIEEPRDVTGIRAPFPTVIEE
jgi:hypothetical protein